MQLFRGDFGRTCGSSCLDVGRIVGNAYFSIVSHVAIQSIECKWVFEQSCSLAHLMVCLWWVNCGKMADWI